MSPRRRGGAPRGLGGSATGRGGRRVIEQVANRLLSSIPVLLGVLLLGFMLLILVPGDPAIVLAGPMAPPEVVARIRTEMGLDDPVLVQFWHYLSRVAQGELGRSMISNRPVVDELASTVGPTAELMLACLVWSIPLGIAMGTVSAVRRGSIVDRAIMAVSVAGVSLPIFFIGLVAIHFLGVQWRLLPFLGRGGPLWTVEGLRHVTLPALSLGLIFIGPVARMTRSSVLEVLRLDHVRTARAKGLSETRVILRHGLRNALIPVVTLVGLQAGYLLGGAVVTETIFSWPGLGRLAVGAILSSDFPVAQGTILVLALGFILVNLVVDILYALLDPRVQRAMTTAGPRRGRRARPGGLVAAPLGRPRGPRGGARPGRRRRGRGPRALGRAARPLRLLALGDDAARLGGGRGLGASARHRRAGGATC